MNNTLLALVALPILAMQCGDKKKLNTQCLQGKVVRTSCASLVVQVTNNDSIGEDGWKDSTSANPATYDNVFSVSNLCKLPAEVKPGNTIYFTIEKPKPSDCVVCMMYDAPPRTQYDIINVSTSPCGASSK